MNSKQTTVSFIASALLISSTAIFAADETSTSLEAGVATAPSTKVDSTKKTLDKVTCEDFLGFDEVIQPKYVIAAAAHAKGGEPKNVVIDVVETETLVPVLIEECTKTPKESFFDKLKDKLKKLSSKL
jgi:acid stress chaperone HdeA